jgi:16S rRNA (guanine527-N7)-methyltransferase
MPRPDAVEALRPRLVEAVQALELDLPAAQIDTLLDDLALLQRWNSTYNLTAVREPAQMLTQHLVDCLAVLPSLRRHLGADRPARILDVGSGGGLPGVVIAATCPSYDVTCVDAVGKKAAFIRQAAGELGLPHLHAEHARVEQLKTTEPFDLITSRAFASLADFVKLTRRHLKPEGVWMAMKGKTPDTELAELPPDVDVFHVEPLKTPGLDAERCLVWMKPRTRPPCP